MIKLFSIFAFISNFFTSQVIAAIHSDYLDDQIPEDFEYPSWLVILGMFIVRLLIAGSIFLSINDFKKWDLSQRLRTVAATILAIAFLIFSYIYSTGFELLLTVGIRTLAIIIGVLLLIGIGLSALSGLRNRLNYKK